MKEAEKTVRVYIPRKSKGDTERFICVNGRAVLVRTGEAVELPAEFAEVLEESARADRESDRYISEKTEGR